MDRAAHSVACQALHDHIPALAHLMLYGTSNRIHAVARPGDRHSFVERALGTGDGSPLLLRFKECSVKTCFEMLALGIRPRMMPKRFDLAYYRNEWRMASDELADFRAVRFPA